MPSRPVTNAYVTAALRGNLGALSGIQWLMPVNQAGQFLVLRSLLARLTRPAASPGRFFSSLSPSFAAGRFAAYLYARA